MKIDNTCLQCAQHCLRKYQYRHVENLVPLRVNETALTFGQAIHKGLEVLYQTQNLQACLTAFTELYKELQIFDVKRTLEGGIKILEDYYSIYFPENFEVVQVETMVTKEILDNVEFCGKIDLIYQDKTTDELVILDHKTSSRMEYILNPNHQFTGYLWLVPDARQFKLNMIGVYAPSSKKTKEEKFLRIGTTRTEADKQEWFIWVKDIVERIEKATQTGTWPMSADCFYCPYQIICTCGEPEGKEMLKRNMFKQVIWEPWNVEGGE